MQLELLKGETIKENYFKVYKKIIEMKSIVNVKWIKKMEFKADVDGHGLIVDAVKENGGDNSGPRPKSLMLVALAGCTGMDVISILEKMKVNIEYFNIEIEANAKDEHPKKYTDIKIVYKFKGSSIEREKVNKAIQLSMDRYCSVYAVYKEVINISYEIMINEN
jgi:putative redox protein